SVEPGVASPHAGGSPHEESPRVTSRESLAHGRDVCGSNQVDSIDARAFQAIGFPRGPAGACSRWSSVRTMWTMALFYPLQAMERLTGRAGEDTVAHYRKQESRGSHVIDFLPPDFHIWP